LICVFLYKYIDINVAEKIVKTIITVLIIFVPQKKPYSIGSYLTFNEVAKYLLVNYFFVG